VFDVDPPTFVQIDPTTGSVVRRLRSPIADVGFFTVHGNEMWISDESRGDVSAIDVRNGHTLRTFRGLPGSGGSAGVAWSHGSLWVARPEAAGGDGILLRLDPRTGRVEHPFRALTGTYAIAAGQDGTIWTGGTFGQVNRIDPVTNNVVRAVTEGRNYSIAAGNGSVWTADTLKGVVYQVDTQGDVISQFETAPGARSVSFRDGVVWVGNRERGTVTRIDASGRESTYRFDHEVISIAAGSGVVLVGFGAPVPGA
jgi:streptogramin lyase